MILLVIFIVLIFVVLIALAVKNSFGDNLGDDDTKTVYICKRCGTPTISAETPCSRCSCSDYLETDMKPSFANEKRRNGEWNRTLKQYFYESQVLQMTQYEHQLRNEARPSVEAKTVHFRETQNPHQLTKDGTAIKCPTCGSTDIERVSFMSKAVDVELFGIFGNKRNKQFKCKNCKYMW